MIFEGEDEVDSTAQTTESVVRAEVPDDYEPTQDEILEYAKCLGMDPDRDHELFWIAREGLKAPLPENWKPCQTGEHHEELENKTKRDEEKSTKKDGRKKKDKVCVRMRMRAGGMRAVRCCTRARGATLPCARQRLSVPLTCRATGQETEGRRLQGAQQKNQKQLQCARQPRAGRPQHAQEGLRQSRRAAQRPRICRQCWRSRAVVARPEESPRITFCVCRRRL